MSSDDIAISVRNLGKTYRLFGHPGDRIKQFLSLGMKKYHNEFTALHDVSFDIKKGETVGIIGRNGSGKSTLLQLICGILKPTTGTVNVNGSISALLELGAGFNPEFTGRENVYFQGAVTGVSKEQMDARFDDIASFADIGEFIDQPVRTYSSGMFVRLAFAVASKLDAEVVILDEALAVGDIAFQARCFERIDQLRNNGATILLVSHSMQHILSHCDSALLLHRGGIAVSGRDVASVVADYEKSVRVGHEVSYPSGAKKNENMRTDIQEKRFGSFEAFIDTFEIEQDGVVTTVLKPGRETVFRCGIKATRSFRAVALGISIRKPGTADLWGDNNILAGRELALHEGWNLIEYAVDFPLSSGEYLVYCGLAAISGSKRVELDQRWPIEKVTVVTDRTQIGFIYAPARISVEA